MCDIIHSKNREYRSAKHKSNLLFKNKAHSEIIKYKVGSGTHPGDRLRTMDLHGRTDHNH